MTVFRPILAFDTSAAHCAAVLVMDETSAPILSRVEPMMKGQAERLVPLLSELMDDAGLGFSELGAIAVGTGPGNFTGVRIAISTARGLSLALKIPAIGLSSFELMRDLQILPAPHNEWVTLAAPRDQIYLQPFQLGQPAAKPQLLDLNDLPSDLTAPEHLTITGHRSDELAQIYSQKAADQNQTADIQAQIRDLDDITSHLANLARAKWASGDHFARPAPLYVRPADAAPPSDPPPVILDA